MHWLLVSNGCDISCVDMQLTYHLRLSNGQDVCASVCLVHSDPLHTLELDRMGENAQPTTGSRRETQLNYQWKRVSRGRVLLACAAFAAQYPRQNGLQLRHL